MYIHGPRHEYNITGHPPNMQKTPPLDPSLYTLGTESLAFFKSTTGIHDDDELKAHILNVQAQAYAVCARGKLLLGHA